MALCSRLHVTGDVSVIFALYGALHAAALSLSLRKRQAIWRKCLFIVFAAALSVMMVRIGVLGSKLTPAGNIGHYSLLGLSSAVGAASYGALIHLAGMYALTIRESCVIAVACMFATLAGLFTATHVHVLGSWWLAVPWWLTFSCGLWYFDRQHPA